MQAYALHLDLGPVPASLDEVLIELGDRFDSYAPRLSRAQAEVELALTVQATDLWLAVLMAMAAVTSTGYPVLRRDARPVERAAAHRGVVS